MHARPHALLSAALDFLAVAVAAAAAAADAAARALARQELEVRLEKCRILVGEAQLDVRSHRGAPQLHLSRAG
jgi:hypothetical protein